jgi:hypothetical protein
VVLSLSAPVTMAAVVDSGPISIAIPQTSVGIYINVVTGVSNVAPALAPGWDLNPFNNSGLAFFNQSAVLNATAIVGAAARQAQ